MLAASRFGQPARRGERVIAIVFVGLIHVVLAIALLRGLAVRLDPSAESPLRLINLDPLAPPPLLPPPPPPKKPSHGRASAPAAVAAPKGGSEGKPMRNIPAPVTPSPRIVLPLAPIATSGGLAGQRGPASGSGAGGGQGGIGDGAGNGAGDGSGGSDLIQVAGAIGPRDYPRRLRESGVGGQVLMSFTVAPTGRVSRCVVTRSSGVAELDELTCRLIRERFVFRPETDRNGRPIASEVDGEHLWVARARD